MGRAARKVKPSLNFKLTHYRFPAISKHVQDIHAALVVILFMDQADCALQLLALSLCHYATSATK